jgi:hypothetical protein
VEEARALLEPLYNSFTQGFDMPDMKNAKALLDTLDTQTVRAESIGRR